MIVFLVPIAAQSDGSSLGSTIGNWGGLHPYTGLLRYALVVNPTAHLGLDEISRSATWWTSRAPSPPTPPHPVSTLVFVAHWARAAFRLYTFFHRIVRSPSRILGDRRRLKRGCLVDFRAIRTQNLSPAGMIAHQLVHMPVRYSTSSISIGGLWFDAIIRSHTCGRIS